MSYVTGKVVIKVIFIMERLESGVPQGLALGPLAFLVYINDIDDSVHKISLIKKFTDDTKVANQICDPQDNDKLQTVIE